MKCPHCLESFHDEFHDTDLIFRSARLVERIPDKPNQTYWAVRTRICPACGEAIVVLLAHRFNIAGNRFVVPIMAWPRGISRAPLPPSVPQKYADDYREACLVLTDSPKASAALSRRCLQLLLRDEAKVAPSDLSKEIDAVLAVNVLPASTAQAIDAVRHLGNFAAHPNKSTNTGEIIPVEPGEAEWSLDVLEALFDHYFVQPALLAAKKAALNQKLADAGKPPMKS